jgi:hypothetical protein
VLHGLRVFAGKKSGHRTIEPTIYVTPLLFLRTVRGAWFKVHEESADHEFEIPYNKEGLVAHLKHVDRAASALLINVNHHLSAQMVPTEPVLSSVRFSRCLQPVERFSLTLPPRDALNFGAFSKMQWGLMVGTCVHNRTAATMSGDRVASESLSDEGPPPFVERRIRSMTRVDFEPLQLTVPLREESPWVFASARAAFSDCSVIKLG